MIFLERAIAWIALIVAAIVVITISCSPNISYIRSGEPCRADSCEVVR